MAWHYVPKNCFGVKNESFEVGEELGQWSRYYCCRQEWCEELGLHQPYSSRRGHRTKRDKKYSYCRQCAMTLWVQLPEESYVPVHVGLANTQNYYCDQRNGAEEAEEAEERSPMLELPVVIHTGALAGNSWTHVLALTVWERGNPVD
jgi:hypothetical protein